MASESQQHVETRKAYPNTAEAYQLIEPIGQGESAVVYRGWCESLQEEVAIKIVDLELFQTSLEEISKEIQVMSLSLHPNVVPYCTSFVCGHDLWVVMPLLAGGDVKSLMDCSFPEGMDEPLVQYILYGVLRAVSYFHKHGQIHRNIKAANILLTVDGRVMLSDYGLVGWMVEGGLKRSIRQTFVGTPCWMAPEVLEQTHGYDYKADIWSYGITALELAQGRAPFSEYPPMKVLLLTLQGPAPSLKGPARQRFSKAFHDLVSQCLQKEPSQRPTASQLLEHKFFKNVKKPSNLADIIAKSPPLGRRSGNQRILVQQVLNNKQTAGSGNNDEIAGGWNFDSSESEVKSEKYESLHNESFDWNEDTQEDKQTVWNRKKEGTDHIQGSQKNELVEKHDSKSFSTQDNASHSDEERKQNDSSIVASSEEKNAKTMTKKGRFVVIEVDDRTTVGDSRSTGNSLNVVDTSGGGRTTPNPWIEEHSPPLPLVSKESHAQPHATMEAPPVLVRELSSHRLANVSSISHSTENNRSSTSFRRGRFEVKEVEDHASNPSLPSRSRPQSPSPRIGLGGGPVGETRGPFMLLAELQNQLIALLNENENLRKENTALKSELEQKK
ncbi:Serine/threonine-protein kinase fray2 [Galdieria sulphuraria]|uniref:Serine/threonine protein kinase n=1 Tax=Galdieria sulphuraria TaxID=130081 RepID=M2WSN4_GALSU|nr:serine/threonine protein kinase [Galdieria sulphuraria]EME26860.1 serine/threonine protein kinase [Galdieria sulphuraria]GJD12581.1 Serine/threonine-protein kinase fray2 [Galdieria sulphuraria]|eukprot:XP_005703380.1 serine/threonine protein kinase [Galdieria sulphuraria]